MRPPPVWVRGLESNQRPLGPEPSVLPLNYPGAELLRALRKVVFANDQDRNVRRNSEASGRARRPWRRGSLP